MDTSVTQGRTYKSREASYDLDPNRLFSVIVGIYSTLEEAKSRADREGAATVSGQRANIGVVEQTTRGIVQNYRLLYLDVKQFPDRHSSFRCDLVLLMLSEDTKHLTMGIRKEKDLCIPSEGFHELGKKYSLRKQLSR